MDKFKLLAIQEITKQFPDLGDSVTDVDIVSKIITYSSGKISQIFDNDPAIEIGDYVISITKYINTDNYEIFVTLEHNSVYTSIVPNKEVKTLSRNMKIEYILND